MLYYLQKNGYNISYQIKSLEVAAMEQIGNKKKQGSIVETLRDAILSGSIPAETEMTQNELAKSLEVSRMPVREALIILEYQGLVKRLPNNHVQAAGVSGAYFESLFSLCAHMESGELREKGRNADLPEDEMAFHRWIYRECPFDLQKKILETITEIYILFAVTRSSYDKERGRDYIAGIREAAAQGNFGKVSLLYGEYFKFMEHTVVKERGRGEC